MSSRTASNSSCASASGKPLADICRLRDVDTISRGFECRAESFAKQRMVVDDEKLEGVFAGQPVKVTRSRKVTPISL